MHKISINHEARYRNVQQSTSYRKMKSLGLETVCEFIKEGLQEKPVKEKLQLSEKDGDQVCIN